MVGPELAVGAGGVLLAVAWLLANRRHVRKRAARAADWETGSERPELWTSAARCPHCSSRGGLLSVNGDTLEFECLACGARHARENRG